MRELRKPTETILILDIERVREGPIDNSNRVTTKTKLTAKQRMF